MMSVIIEVRGTVQGVGFRPTVARVARSMGLAGYVLNKGSHVRICLANCSREDANTFVQRLASQLGPTARMEKISFQDGGDCQNSTGFEIRESQDDARYSIVPPDTAICPDCLKELFDRNNRRYLYPFTNCTVCGARFSIIDDLPYDRERTAMSGFTMCTNCQHEYENLNDRRYDAQTISCPECGPELTYYTKDGKPVEHNAEALKLTARGIDEGKIIVIKSWGGMHIATRADIVDKMRRWYGRPYKPFAVMAADITALRRITDPTPEELKELMSSQRPIVLVKKKKDAPNWVENLAPGIDTIGAFLPYTAIHHILMDMLDSGIVIMTSANRPGGPMIIDNEKAFKLGADGYLLHNRSIINRVDDSLLRINSGRRLFIRRSRGVVPEAIDLPFRINAEVVAVGAELNNAGAVTRGGRLFMTQYIGDCSDTDNLDFLESSLRRYTRLFKISSDEIGYVVIDLHPSYSTRYLASELADEFNAELLSYQHHYAHCASLMLDAGLEETVALVLDGTGYGTDGKIWGGEVIHASAGQYERVAHLAYFPLPGGDMAVKDPARTLCALAHNAGHSMWGDYFGEGATNMEKLARHSPKSSSMGRFMDALAALFLNIRKKTYEGEPAMRLERLLNAGSIIESCPKCSVNEGSVELSEVFAWVLDHPELKAADRAASAVNAVLRALYVSARDRCMEFGLREVGLSGGVSYNGFVLHRLMKWCSEDGLKLITHSKLPPGDGGIAAGQAHAALMEYAGKSDK